MTKSLSDSAWRFVAMPPGWHITTGPGATLYEPTAKAEGRFAVESELFIFPLTTDNGFGLFVGGRALESDSAEYLAFLIRRDGHAAVHHHRGGTTHTIVPWQPSAAIVPNEGKGGSRRTC